LTDISGTNGTEEGINYGMEYNVCITVTIETSFIFEENSPSPTWTICFCTKSVDIVAESRSVFSVHERLGSDGIFGSCNFEVDRVA
jgi:hypothetical protein